MAAAVAATGFVSCSSDDGDESTPPKYYTVQYSTDIGVAPSSITVVEGTVLTSDQLAAPAKYDKEMYVFDGWTDASGTAVAAGSYEVNGNVALKAEWSLAELTEDWFWGKSFLATLTDSDGSTYESVVDFKEPSYYEDRLVEGNTIRFTTRKYYSICDKYEFTGDKDTGYTFTAWESTKYTKPTGRSKDSPNLVITFGLSNDIKIDYANVMKYDYEGYTPEQEQEAFDNYESGMIFSETANQQVSLSGTLKSVPGILDCYVTAMGGQQFGHAVFKGISFKNDSGTIKCTLKLGTGTGVIFGISFMAYVEAGIKSVSDGSVSVPGYYADDGTVKNAEYTVSNTDFGVSADLETKKFHRVYAVDSVTFPVSRDKSEYNLWLYINSNIMGVQFCDGSGKSSSMHPNEATPYVGKIVIDWDKVVVE